MDIVRLGITQSSRKTGSKGCTLFLLKQILTENIQFEHENEMHIYDTSLLNCTSPRLLFPWFRSSTWKAQFVTQSTKNYPSPVPRHPRYGVVQNQQDCLNRKLAFCSHFLKIWSIGQYQQEIRPWWSFYPFQMYQTLPSSAVLPHYQEACHCDSECPTP